MTRCHFTVLMRLAAIGWIATSLSGQEASQQPKASVAHHSNLPKVDKARTTDWADHNGDLSNSRYALLDQLLVSWSASAVLAQTPQSQWDGVYTDTQAARGELLYVDNCVMCHGRDLAGTVLAPALAGPAFTAQWKARPLSMVFEIIQTRMPWNLSGHLSAQQNADVLAFMLKKGGSPAGQRDLPARAEALKAITILESRP